MTSSVQCPQCHRQLKLNGPAAGKKIKCPAAECNHVFVVPAAPTAAPTPPGTIGFADEPPPEPKAEAKAARRRSAKMARDLAASGAHYQVVLADGRAVAMDAGGLCGALLKGTTDRFNRVRPVESEGDNVSIHGLLKRKHRARRAKWHSLGNSQAMTEPEIEELYAGIVAHPAVHWVASGIMFLIAAAVVLPPIYSFDADPERIREVIREESGGGWRAGVFRSAVLMFPEGYAFFLKIVFGAIFLLLSAFLTLELGYPFGWIFGLAWYFWHRDSWQGPPLDGYPWKLWAAPRAAAG